MFQKIELQPERRFIHIDGSRYEAGLAGRRLTNPSLRTGLWLAAFEAVGFAMTQPMDNRARVLALGAGVYGIGAVQGAMIHRRVLSYFSEAKQCAVIDKRGGPGWADHVETGELRRRHAMLAHFGIRAAQAELVIFSLTGFALGHPTTGLMVGSAAFSGRIVPALWSLRAAMKLGRGKWKVLAFPPQLSLKRQRPFAPKPAPR